MEKEKTVVEYNNKSEYQNKRVISQKANGELQAKETTIKADIPDGMLELGLNSIEDFYKMCIQRGLKVVSPYILGREPDV